MRMMKKKATIERVLDRARSYAGMRSLPLRNNDFGKQAGYGGAPWDGAFLQTVLREEDLHVGTAFTASTVALAYFFKQNRLYVNPKPGDIVFYHFAATNTFEQPHVGLVTEVTDWKKNRTFRAIEGETSPGTPRGHGESDGVYERVRFETDVLAFARPVYGTLPEAVETSTELRPSQFQNNKSSGGVVTLQTALHKVTGATGFVRGKFDSQTRSAVRRFQREAGIADGNGSVDVKTLRALGRLSGLFKARD